MKNYLRKLAFIAFFGMILTGCEKDLYEDAFQKNNFVAGKQSFKMFNIEGKEGWIQLINANS